MISANNLLGVSDAAFGNYAIWMIATISTLAVIVRPWRLPEATWAVAGAAMLVILGLLPYRDAFGAVAKGTDIYLFLTGMMLLAELARREGLFAWLAALAARRACGSAQRLFVLVYAVGTLVTIFLSNDATAVVLTPAVFAAAQAAEAEPLPYLFVCAFIANAASFVLPISNPANLVIFASDMPPLLVWLQRFTLPSILSIGATYLVLRMTQRRFLRRTIRRHIELPAISAAGLLSACGIAATALALLAASAFGLPLGWPTCLAAISTTAIISIHKHEWPGPNLKDISWGVLPLVAGLFMLVEALNRTGVLEQLSRTLHYGSQRSAGATASAAGLAIALLSNVANNLPAGLLASSALSAAHAPPPVAGALLIGVDLGPNLSVTGSLATILWLAALRREEQEVSAWTFLKLGALVMPPALLLAIGGLIVARH